MPSYLIEIPHEDEHAACVRALHAIEQYGSHFMTHAYWGCPSGVHSGQLVAELDCREDALRMVPPEFRRAARIIEVRRYTREGIRELLEGLEP